MREQSEGQQDRQRDSERLQEAGGPLGYGKREDRGVLFAADAGKREVGEAV